MSRLNKNTPEGTRDRLYGEAALYEQLSAGFAGIYESAGFSMIHTPVIENYDLVAAVNPSLKPATLYKLTDTTGNLLVIRPDNTTPIARVVATKLKNAPLPQKLCYTQSIYRINSDYSGKRNEILQSGIELVGASGLKSDLLCITTALDALRSLGLKCKLEIGHVGYFNALIADMNLTPDEAMTVRAFIEEKNYVSLNMFDKKLINDTLRRLPLLYGSDEVFAEARALACGNADADAALDYVETLYRLLCDAGYADSIMIDMGIVHKFDYYTGVVFRGYIEQAGEPVLKGGRYDNLLAQFDYDVPATGFGINICAVADALIRLGRLPAPKKADAVLFCEPQELSLAGMIRREYAAEGKICELSVFDTREETLAYAAAHGIARVIDVTGKEIQA